MRATVLASVLAVCTAFNLPLHASTSRIRCVPPALQMDDRQEATAADVDVSMAAADVERLVAEEEESPTGLQSMQSLVGKGLLADERLPDGRIPIRINFDIRWFLFLGLFAAGEDSILEATQPLRDLSIGGVQPFDAIVTMLAGPVIRSGDGSEGTLREVPTGGLVIVLAYFAYWKGWTAQLVTAVRSKMQDFRDRDRQ